MSEVKGPTEKNDRNAKGKELATSVPKVGIERDPKVTKESAAEVKEDCTISSSNQFHLESSPAATRVRQGLMTSGRGDLLARPDDQAEILDQPALAPIAEGDLLEHDFAVARRAAPERRHRR